MFDQNNKQLDEEEWKKIFKKDLESAILKCLNRGLIHTAKWLSELNFTLKDVKCDNDDSSIISETSENEKECYFMCKCYFDLKEYDRCAYFTEKCESPCAKFLHYYSRYMAFEKKRVEDMTEQTCLLDSSQTAVINSLQNELAKERTKNNLDGFCCYLYGILCKRLNLQDEAIDALCEAIRKEPLNWGAWKELTGLIDDVRIVKTLNIPHSHWMKYFFLGHLYLDHQMNQAAIQLYWSLREKGLQESRYIQAQLAICYHNHRIVEKAIAEFSALQAADPYRLDNLDIYSNLLYIKEKKALLSHLAHRACEIDKYRVETCCIVGNLYSLRAEHQKAVVYFQRALKINPQYLCAWTLMGHEYMEMKNSSAAIQSYRQAIEANRRDYRAWYGLGQTYEILRMPSYCLYYYQQAQLLQPNDSRMLLAVGEIFEKLGQNENAIRSYKLARNVGDIEGTALIKLAKLMQKLGIADVAAGLYKEYVADCETRETCDKGELCRAYKFLAIHCLRYQELQDAYQYAQKCLLYEETKEEAKSLLRDIAVMQKNPQEEQETSMEEENSDSRRVLFYDSDLLWDNHDSSNPNTTS
ncbi:cell division cycle, putative [Pediculus humanus corporis]|uniref:Cell division cycle, putative n=1 Tax=Pediculus humanus subsp. corporis TaxID=121224 RepID=E0VJJ6_PEDHC|nr:cell division cycle, putative [Pediculus humanus corporis]EEB13552.1 cell division cycle, putative [Pediculus humanus corporis]